MVPSESIEVEDTQPKVDRACHASDRTPNEFQERRCQWTFLWWFNDMTYS